MMKNPCGKMRKRGHAYEIWHSPIMGWKWHILKKWQSPEKEKNNVYARWFCDVYTPIVPDGELGDTYVHEIIKEAGAVLISTHEECSGCYK